RSIHPRRCIAAGLSRLAGRQFLALPSVRRQLSTAKDLVDLGESDISGCSQVGPEFMRRRYGEMDGTTSRDYHHGSTFVEKGPSASLRSIASLQRIGKYASARRFSLAPRIWTFLSSLEAEFFNTLLGLRPLYF